MNQNGHGPILIVENRLADLDLAKRVFARRGLFHPIQEARDGEEAIFSLFTVGENGREISFRTIDQSITDILGETFTALKDTKKAVATAPVLNLLEYAYLLQSK